MKGVGNFRFLFTVKVTSHFEYFFFYLGRPTCKYLKGKHHLGELSADDSAIRNGSQSNWIGGYGLDSAGSGRVVVVGCLECQNEPLGSGTSGNFVTSWATLNFSMTYFSNIMFPGVISGFHHDINEICCLLRFYTALNDSSLYDVSEQPICAIKNDPRCPETSVKNYHSTLRNIPEKTQILLCFLFWVVTSNSWIATDSSQKPDVSILTYSSSALKMGLVDSSEASISVLSNNTASHTKQYLSTLVSIPSDVTYP